MNKARQRLTGNKELRNHQDAFTRHLRNSQLFPGAGTGFPGRGLVTPCLRLYTGGIGGVSSVLTVTGTLGWYVETHVSPGRSRVVLMEGVSGGSGSSDEGTDAFVLAGIDPSQGHAEHNE